MAIRPILEMPDEALLRKSREVTSFDERFHKIMDDMIDTVIDSGGVGLAAPQVGVLRRAVIVLETNVEEDEDEYLIELVNPEIIEFSGEQCGPEGCLSVPGNFGIVTRPMYAKVRAQDRFGEFFEVEGEGLTARAFFHEIDHLDGIVFTEKAERMLDPEEMMPIDEDYEDE